MLFKEELAQKIILGEKTQTRRPIKPGEELAMLDGLKTIMMGNGKRIKYQVGRDYSIQYGRGLPTRMWHKAEGLMDWEFYQDALAQEKENFHKISGLMGWKPLRIKLLDICAEDVRNISHVNCIAEGFGNGWPKLNFLVTWVSFYDTPIVLTLRDCEYDPNNPDHTPLFLGDRRSERYQAWALTFELVIK